MSYKNAIAVLDPRIKSDICGAQFESRTGLWVCIKEPHAAVYHRRRNGEMVFETNKNVDRHYFVKKLNHSLEE